MRVVFSGPDVKLFDHAVGETGDIVPLFRGAIAKACAPHIFQTADIEFQPEPVRSQSHRKNMRLAMAVFKLDITQKIIWNLDPKDLI